MLFDNLVNANLLKGAEMIVFYAASLFGMIFIARFLYFRILENRDEDDIKIIFLSPLLGMSVLLIGVILGQLLLFVGLTFEWIPVVIFFTIIAVVVEIATYGKRQREMKIEAKEWKQDYYNGNAP